MEWDVVDPRGFAGLRLGDGVADLRARWGARTTFRRTPAADETDYFTDAGILATYGPDGRVTFLEIVDPATPALAGVALLGRPLDDVARALGARGLPVDLDPDGGVVTGWGVGLYAPVGRVEGVSIGC